MSSCHVKQPCADVNAKTLNECENAPFIGYRAIPPVTVKVPRVLAELNVQIDVDATITLPERALEIKQIKKRLKLTQCMLLQNTNKLFLKGFVRKNIDYSTVSCANRDGVCGDIRHCTVDIPFSCVTPVKFNLGTPVPALANFTQEFEYLTTSPLKGPEFAEKDRLMSGDLSEFNQVSFENFNELPFCELVASRITEFDEFLDRERPDHIKLPFEEKIFKTIEEKMVINLILKVLQLQQVFIPGVGKPPCPPTPPCHGKKKDGCADKDDGGLFDVPLIDFEKGYFDIPVINTSEGFPNDKIIEKYLEGKNKQNR